MWLVKCPSDRDHCSEIRFVVETFKWIGLVVVLAAATQLFVA